MKAVDYAIRDISLADFGRKEITIAETEMPGLMACREELRCTNLRLITYDHPDGCVN